MFHTVICHVNLVHAQRKEKHGKGIYQTVMHTKKQLLVIWEGMCQQFQIVCLVYGHTAQNVLLIASFGFF